MRFHTPTGLADGLGPESGLESLDSFAPVSRVASGGSPALRHRAETRLHKGAECTSSASAKAGNALVAPTNARDPLPGTGSK